MSVDDTMKPGDFFLGVTELFSILLPGAAIAFIGLFWAHSLEIPPDHLLAGLLGLESTVGWAAFLVVSYILGHVVGSLGAHLDPLYDERRRKHRNEALKALADAQLKSFSEQVTSKIAKDVRVITRPVPTIFARVVDWAFLWGAWNGRAPGPASTTQLEQPINAYKLARAILNCRAPGLFSEVVRFEADSKFFRSLVVVASFAMVPCIGEFIRDTLEFVFDQVHWLALSWSLAYLLFVFVVLRIAFARFCELRLKATETAFQGMLVVAILPAQPGKSVDSDAARKS